MEKKNLLVQTMATPALRHDCKAVQGADDSIVQFMYAGLQDEQRSYHWANSIWPFESETRQQSKTVATNTTEVEEEEEERIMMS